MIESELYYIFAIVSLLFSMGNYALLRGIIWSIALCNIGKRTYRSAEFKSKKNISMSYLSDYITHFRKQYYFWMRAKRFFVIFQFIWFFVYVFLPLFTDNLTLPFVFNIAQSFVLFVLIGVQYDVNRNTKYDRVHQNKP